ncbi:MBL fold metallo-hydrolase [Asticcacaulis sp. BYS171W]|uniref:MBL fold metallo-hydrolase n=1 Tax=Asticcacaulis aquaticus TaxID=2984212 RepID=A0ABT5HNU1_9CAUL|nr:MBL fold metallo-hydrolase [Asticcacaulis aquaticus]MDC7681731.1 MBL fold metallo-hydrolase [Asticcacaulis aquaticus]
MAERPLDLVVRDRAQTGMKITHLNNSFLMIEGGGTKLLCDPWAGTANEGGWRSFPEFDPEVLYAFMVDCDAVYISHLHADHFDPALLRAAGLVDKPFIIKDFQNKTLLKRIKALGVETVIEVPALHVTIFKNLQFAIVPQMTSNNAALDDEIDYDLDTSIIVHADGQTFFNQVDNPLSLANYTAVKAFITATFGDLDCVCLATGAASPYPQSFIACDRDAEQAAVITRSLDKFSAIIDILQPRTYFPAGGTYIIPGRFAPLNRWIAQPDFATLKSTLNDRAQAFALEGGQTLNLDRLSISPALSPGQVDRDTAVRTHAADTYTHDSFDDSGISDRELDDLFARAYANYSRKMTEDKVTIAQSVAFVLYDRLSVDDKGHISSVPCGGYRFADHVVPGMDMIFHLDRRLFVKGLTRAANWNQLLSLALFERRPNAFHPTVEFSLNYLTS